MLNPESGKKVLVSFGGKTIEAQAVPVAANELHQLKFSGPPQLCQVTMGTDSFAGTFIPGGLMGETKAAAASFFSSGRISNERLAAMVRPEQTPGELIQVLQELQKRFDSEGQLLFGSRAVTLLQSRLAQLVEHPSLDVQQLVRELQVNLGGESAFPA